MVWILVRPRDGAGLRPGLSVHQPSSCHGGVFLFTFLFFFLLERGRRTCDFCRREFTGNLSFCRTKKKKKNSEVVRSMWKIARNRSSVSHRLTELLSPASRSVRWSLLMDSLRSPTYRWRSVIMLPVSAREMLYCVAQSHQYSTVNPDVTGFLVQLRFIGSFPNQTMKTCKEWVEAFKTACLENYNSILSVNLSSYQKLIDNWYLCIWIARYPCKWIAW